MNEKQQREKVIEKIFKDNTKQIEKVILENFLLYTPTCVFVDDGVMIKPE